MKTKAILLVAAIAAFMTSTQVIAQNANNTSRQNRADVNELLDKRCHRMQNHLNLDEATAAKFAPLYKEYLKELKACHPTTCKTTNKSKCTDAEKKACMEKRFDYREKMLKTQKKYYHQFEKFLTADQLQTLFSPKRHAGNKCDKMSKRNGQCHHKAHKNHARCNK